MTDCRHAPGRRIAVMAISSVVVIYGYYVLKHSPWGMGLHYRA